MENKKSKEAPVFYGGQAVIEGVMMRGKKVYALAVRHMEKKTVEVRTVDLKPASERLALFKLPVFRGMAAFVESLVVGMKVITVSAEMAGFDDFEEEPTGFEKKLIDFLGPKLNDVMIGISVVFAILLSVGLFMVLPVFIANFFRGVLTNRFVLSFSEGIIRILILVGYVTLISRMKDIQRVFQYHGAEHKTINCYEGGKELTVENVHGFTRIHKRCGTSFLVFVVLISMVVFMLIPVSSPVTRILSRIVLVPFVAGFSYEVIRWAGKSESGVVTFVSRPGMWLQQITTYEPDDEQIEVAIASLKAVFEAEKVVAADAEEVTKAREVLPE